MAGAMGLSVSDVRMSYDGVPVLKGINHDFPEGKVTALLGSNGAGKSTLVKIISGTVRPDGGEVRLDDHPLREWGPKARIRAGISTINQEVALVPQFTVAENLLVGRESLAGKVLTDSAVTRVAREILDRSGIQLDVKLNTRARMLGASQRQLLEIAIALSRNARVIVMDEPTSSLSAREVQGLFAAMRHLRESNRVVILVSHRLDEVMAISDQIVVLRDGLIALAAARDASSPADIVTAMVGQVVAPGAVRARRTAADTGTGEPVLRADGLAVPGVPGSVELALWPGEIVGITGAAGSGLTELGMVLGGALRPSAGTLWLKGRPLPAGRPRQARRSGVAFLPEGRRTMGLILKQPISVNVSLDALRRFTSAGVLRLRKERSDVADAVRSVDLVYRSLDQTAAQLSGGNQQKVLFSRMLLANPSVYVLAQPTAGVDVKARQEIYSTIRRLASKGAAIVVLSSDLDDIVNLAARGYVLTRQGFDSVADDEVSDQAALTRRILAS